MAPLRKTNLEMRPREHLYENEVNKLIETCKQLGRHVERNKALILVAYRHALRPSEAVALQWNDICFSNNTMQIHRVKGSKSGEHQISDKEIRYLKRLRKECPKNSPYLFYSAKGGHLSLSGFEKMFEKLGKLAGLPFKIHPHMLRHSWGYKAINSNVDLRAIQNQMGHINIANTVIYASLKQMNFDHLWEPEIRDRRNDRISRTLRTG